MSDRLPKTNGCLDDHDTSSASTTNRKRKSRCDIVDLENQTPPAKKLAIVPPSIMSVDFLSRSSRTSESSSPSSPGSRNLECGAIYLQQPATSLSHPGATSPLMSIDFLARSSRSPCTHRPLVEMEFAFTAPVGLSHPYVDYILY